MFRTTTALLAAATVAGFGATANADTIELHGASQFDEEHAFTKTMRRFEELTQECYDGDLNFVMHLNSELGVERDFFQMMSQGVSVDYAVVAPSHMASLSPQMPLMDMPFLFRDLDHWNAVLDSGTAFELIEQEVLQNANVRVIGYAGGGTRNLISDHPIHNMEELAGFQMRVMGAPIQAMIFEAITAEPSVIAYNEVYNAVQTGVVDGLENEAAGIEQMKFYEVAPYIILTQHAITVRPLMFSEATFQRLPEDLQACVLEAGREAGRHGREVESSQDSEKLEQMEANGWLETVPFDDRDQLLELSLPVQDEFAAELGATETLERVRGM
ncbi:MAG: TRAP transporter substrate-binding protein [Rhodospirillaceae bacterium]|nr:TRAP transporter substrate-binding protein [Rhodospirillaceae bacterium]